MRVGSINVKHYTAWDRIGLLRHRRKGGLCIACFWKSVFQFVFGFSFKAAHQWTVFVAPAVVRVLQLEKQFHKTCSVLALHIGVSFKRVRNIAKSHWRLRYVSPSVRLSAYNSSTPAGRIFMKFDIWLFRKAVGKIKFHSNRTIIKVLRCVIPVVCVTNEREEM